MGVVKWSEAAEGLGDNIDSLLRGRLYKEEEYYTGNW